MDKYMISGAATKFDEEARPVGVIYDHRPLKKTLRVGGYGSQREVIEKVSSVLGLEPFARGVEERWSGRAKMSFFGRVEALTVREGLKQLRAEGLKVTPVKTTGRTMW